MLVLGRAGAGRLIWFLALAGLIATTLAWPARSASATTTTGAATAAAPVAHPGIFHAMTPTRMLDSSAPAAGTIALATLGGFGLPASGVGAVVLNVTVASAPHGGFVTVYPFGATRPATSNLNFVAGQTVANLVVVRLGTSGKISLFNSSAGSARLVVDISGYYEDGTAVDGGAFQPVAPERVLDTRTGLGDTAASAAAHGTASVHLPGDHGLPTTNVAAVVLNVTVASPQVGGFATVYPSGVTRPGTSTLNFPASRTVPNLTIVKVGADGKVNFYNGSAGPVRFVADVFGYFLDGAAGRPGAFTVLTPARIMDTRTAAYPGAPSRFVPPHGIVQLPVGSKGGLPPYGGGAVVLNLTVTGAKGSGYITVYPGGSTRPLASNLNFSKGSTIANLVVVRPNVAGTVSFYNSSAASVQLVADVSGYMRPPTAVHFRTASNLGHLTYPASVACASASFCVAAAGQGRVARWNGATWTSAQDLFGTADGTARIACPTATFCLAVSKLGQARSFNGTSWAAAVSIGVAAGGTVAGLACASTNLCVSVDSQGKAHRFNGSTWSTTTVTTRALLAVSCGSVTFCMTVTGAQTAFRFNGTTWSSVSASALGMDGVVGLSCFPDDTCLVADQIGEGRRFNGTAWVTGFGLTLGTPETFSCASSTFCLATDGASAATYNGTAWSDVAGPPRTLVALDCVTTTACAGLSSDGYAATYNGSTWSAEAGVDPPFGNGTDVSCTNAGFCAVVSTSGAVVTGDGTTWSTPQAVTPRHALVSVSCPLNAFCVAIDNDSASTFDGASWSAPITVDVDAQLVDVSCATLTFCVAVTTDGRAFTFNGSTWSGAVTIAGMASGVVCVSASSCTALVDRRWVTDYNGATWSAPVQVDVIETLNGISCPDSTTCVAVDTAGQVFTRTGPTWAMTATLTPAGGGLSSVSCANSTNCVVTVDQEADVYTFDGEVWNNTDDSGARLLDHVSCIAAQNCVALDDGVNAYRGGGV